MKKDILFFCLLFLMNSFGLKAQWMYDAKSTESSTGDYKDIGKKATLITANYNGTSLDDDDNSSIQNVGFDFKYNGQNFNTFVLNTNGFIKLGSVAPSSKAIYYSSAVGGGNSTITIKDSNLIYPFNRNMITGNETKYKVVTTGKTGKRICTIQFENLVDKVNLPQYTAISFQIKLYEGSNIIEFVYGEWTPTSLAGTLTIAAVGIKGNSVENSVNVAKGSSVKWDETMGQDTKPYKFINGNYAAKGPNFGNKNSVLPEAGHTYKFIPVQ